MKKNDKVIPGTNWSYRTATPNQLETLSRLEKFAGISQPINENLTMLEAHLRINKALKQIKTNIQIGGTVSHYVLSAEEWKEIQNDVASGKIYRDGMTQKEWDQFQKEIYEDLEKRGII